MKVYGQNKCNREDTAKKNVKMPFCLDIFKCMKTEQNMLWNNVLYIWFEWSEGWKILAE